MKQVADMEPDEASKVFSHLEEKQQLDPLTTSVDDDTIKKPILVLLWRSRPHKK